MAAGVELSAGRTAGGGIAMEFPAGDENSCLSPQRLPRRLRRRFLDVECKSPRTVEEIEAKLRDADLRRQKHYETLSCKARSKPRSPSRSSSQEEDLGQRLEAKLQAAEQKRLSILAKSQRRLARLDELRQAAKTGVKMRYENERVKLGTKVESRVQQAEVNRMLILKARRQRRATLRDRSSQSLLRRMARESKYKERVRAAIHQKRVAAEAKRLGLLEAEKKRAHARVSQVKHIAKSVSNQREIERRKMKDQLEDRLQRAKRQRAEYLRHRGRLRGHVRENWNRMPKQAEILSRKLARCWRQFRSLTKTTFALAKAYDALGINQKSVKSMPFEQLARLIESISTIQTTKALLDRVESRLQVSRVVDPANILSSLDNIDHLLKRVATPKKKVTPRSSTRSRETKRVSSVKESNRNPARSSRYPVRVVLCAYMILGHPDAVFSGMGEREISLAKSAEEFVQMFELLVKIILEGPVLSSDEESDSATLKRFTFKSQLAAFDRAWCSYLHCFVVWKVKDAQLLEKDLVRAACQLEASMIQTCKLTPEGDNDRLTHDMKAIQHQVSEDQKLLREKVQHLSGDAGIERMESALSETRSKFFKANESTSTSPFNFSPSLSPVASSTELNTPLESNRKPSRVVRSLFNESEPSLPRGSSLSAGRINSDGQLGSSDEKLVTENELFVNEFLHERHHSFSDGLGIADHCQSSIEGKIKQTMEKAFWDSIMESINQEQPNYDRVVQLMREVRDEICEMAPQSWKEDILSAIDLDIFSQVLQSGGNLDVDYLGKILEFSLVTLQKLSAPANEETIKAKHHNLFLELNEICQLRDESKNSCVMALIKGLQFVLEQTQILKKEISKARIRLMEPLLKGPAGLDYLKNAFANRYGSPSDAKTSLPSTLRWLSSVRTSKDQDWEEHLNSSSALGIVNSSSSQGCLPSTTLRTGGRILSKATGSQTAFSAADAITTGDQLPECRGELIDLVVRLGLLELVSGISGLTQEDLPETLSLNLFRLRSVQSQIQRIIVISTSILICRQILVSEKAVGSTVGMESIVSKCAEKLADLLDRDQEVSVDNIVEVICDFSAGGDLDIDAGKLQKMKVVAARMLPKSLQAGDAVFERVSNAVYTAVRGVVLGGNGVQGRKLAEMALRKVGAGLLTERVVKAAEVLIVAATISVSVHGPWYKYLTDNMSNNNNQEVQE
ncbi:uncharacterized protein LOC114717192 [Neltuma alba]|uniref:uncharacterized protein LOC114717192 n=1 Tax=Neltuma alba TaxID=207710 RepID=UPI0010A2AE61|nr:uncharacterized protein LOC114717192 [Prosopis alba]